MKRLLRLSSSIEEGETEEYVCKCECTVVIACMHVCVDGGGRGEGGVCARSVCKCTRESRKQKVTAQTYNFTYLSFSSVSTPVSDDVLVCACVHMCITKIF